MKRNLLAIAAAALCTIAIGAGPSVAADAGTGSAATTVLETGYVPTQGRGFRRGGGGAVFVAPRRRNNTGRNIAIGVGAAVLGAAILSQGARASGGGGNSCGRWAFRCDRGEGWACRNYNRYC